MKDSLLLSLAVAMVAGVTGNTPAALSHLQPIFEQVLLAVGGSSIVASNGLLTKLESVPYIGKPLARLVDGMSFNFNRASNHSYRIPDKDVGELGW